jgi:hypothetical protein
VSAHLFDNPAYWSLSPGDREMVDTATDPDFPAWLSRVRRIGGCQRPIHLRGLTRAVDPTTGEIVSSFSSDGLPHGRLMLACGNRRASVCAPCSWLHQGDTWHLIAAGLSGGKGLPADVATHPRVFATFTAPSFGPVHRLRDRGMPCRPRRTAAHCEHGNPQGCEAHHAESDRLAGTPLCPACYDYNQAVLWNANTRDLWRYLRRDLEWSLTRAARLPRGALKHHLRVSYAKVAEYQRRGAIHFHAVIRLDGPGGPGDPAPGWASVELLTVAVREAAAGVRVPVPPSAAVGALTLTWGAQLDVRPVWAGEGEPDELTARTVASYLAKYISKGHLPGVTIDSRIRSPAEIEGLVVTDHVRSLVRTCWRLGELAEFEELGLRRWAHQLGYRGHIATKSRAYSTTYAALRGQRAAYRRDGDEPTAQPPNAMASANWTYAGSGYTDGQAMFAGAVTEQVAFSRDAARDARQEEARIAA